jgi:ankyrin repeat protein
LTEEKNFLQQSVLHISVNKPNTLELLLSHGFAEIVDAGDRDGTTPLMYAAAYGKSSSAITLLRAGADPWLFSDTKELYLGHALERGHFDLIEDIVKFHMAKEDPAMAQLTLDVALHYYVWRNKSFIDLSSACLRKLLELGARPKWVTDKGNTLFHAINSVKTASILLEFSFPPTNCRNAIGHTPLMVLSWLLDVDLVRKLLSAGVLINERDSSGLTVFEHLFRANSSRCSDSFCYRRCGVTTWVPTFQIAFDLHQAGADFGSSDFCTCHCSSQGCTALQFLFPSIHSDGGRRHNLRWLPWTIEHFLLLRGLHKGGLQILIKSLIRRQRFDEIGLTHTCCLTLKSSFLPRYFSPYVGATAEECCEDDHVSPINVDHKELQEEQQELVEALEGYCQDFAKQEELTPTDCESALITTLARRIVFIERGVEMASHSLTTPPSPQKSRQSPTKVSCPLNFQFRS